MKSLIFCLLKPSVSLALFCLLKPSFFSLTLFSLLERLFSLTFSLVQGRPNVSKRRQWQLCSTLGLAGWWLEKVETGNSASCPSVCHWAFFIITIQARETPMNTITAHQSAVKAVSWCPWQNNVLATAGQTSFTYHSCRSPWRSGGTVDRTVRIWNTASMTQLQSFDTGSQVLLSSCSKSVEKLHCSACRFPRSPGTASTRRWSRGTDFRITSLQFGVILGEQRSFILQIDHPIPSNGNTMKCF